MLLRKATASFPRRAAGARCRSLSKSRRIAHQSRNTPGAAGVAIPEQESNLQRRRWESNPLRPGCSRLPGRLAPASRVSSSGVEPDPRPSQGRMRSTTPRGQKYPGPDSNRDPDFRKVRCCPLHHQDERRADGWIRTSMRRFTGPLPFSVEPRRQEAGAQGFEPCEAALETACSPRSTLLNGIRLSAFGHRPPRAGTRRPKADRWPTPDRTGCPRGIEPATSTVTASHADRYTTDTIHQTAFGYRHSASKAAESRWSKADSRPSTPTRTRTRNPSFEARHDLRFTIGAKAEGKGVEPSSPVENRLSRAARPTISGYLPEWTHRESNPDFQSAELVSSPWTMSPYSQGSGNRTHVLQLPRLADCRFPIPRRWTARDLHPHFRRAEPASFSWTSSPSNTLDLCPLISDRCSVIPDGLEPSLPRCRPGVVAAGPRDQISSRGGNRTHNQSPGSRPGRFAGLRTRLSCGGRI
jgi:hypothetical protein